MSFIGLRTGAVSAFPTCGRARLRAAKPKGANSVPSPSACASPSPGARTCWCCFRSPARTPASERFAAVIPDTEKRRAGLDGTLRLWLILDEYHQDVIGRSVYLEPDPPLGYLSKAFFLPLLQAFIRRRSQARAVQRHRE